MMKKIMLIATFLLSGCSLMTAKPYQAYRSESDLSECITKTYYNEKCVGLDPGEAYAMRSIYSARNQHAYGYTLVMASIGNEALFQTSEPGMWFGSIFFYMTVPFIFLYETGKYPFSLYDHLTIDDKKVDAALRDLKSARENGYDERYMYFIPYGWPVKHLDQ